MTTAYLGKPESGIPSLKASFLDAMRESGDCFEDYTEALSNGASMRPGTEPAQTADFWWWG